MHLTVKNIKWLPVFILFFLNTVDGLRANDSWPFSGKNFMLAGTHETVEELMKKYGGDTGKQPNEKEVHVERMEIQDEKGDEESQRFSAGEHDFSDNCRAEQQETTSHPAPVENKKKRKVDFESLVKETARLVMIGRVIEELSDPLNDFVNGLLGTYSCAFSSRTKVVPLLSVGVKTYLGMAQITGSREGLRRTRAVVMVEGKSHDGRYRYRAYIPSDTANPLRFQRVPGVGVSAVIEGEFRPELTGR